MVSRPQEVSTDSEEILHDTVPQQAVENRFPPEIISHAVWLYYR